MKLLGSKTTIDKIFRIKTKIKDSMRSLFHIFILAKMEKIFYYNDSNRQNIIATVDPAIYLLTIMDLKFKKGK